VSTLAGDGTVGSNDGNGTNAQFNHTNGIIFRPGTTDLYIADGGNCTIRKMDNSGNVTTVSGTP
jgi:hypothetical protein